MIRNLLLHLFLATLNAIIFCLPFGFTTAKAVQETPFGPYRFPTPTATVHITGTTYYQTVWRKAITAWNRTGAFTFKIATQPKVQAKTWSNTTTQLSVAGQTQLFNSGDEITSAITQLNSGVFKYYHYSEASRVIVAEHELGHVIGLEHNPSPHSVMYFQNRYVPIQDVDIQSVRDHYALPLLPISGNNISKLNNSSIHIICNMNGKRNLNDQITTILN
ncbi:matrixin family metalloprotease [Secundilactobacillus folii]|uniref:Matrixin family metalloprotease n=1 Tax=Secundilactobacillus folii TaxID=2678357 RepID=A0A7X2XUB0_9LACO|nr:M57 family metalloprotease [Secundilactobacillus folii]MTV81738.1 matrixin family metalloprotease [Secundilactobacillus folii]